MKRASAASDDLEPELDHRIGTRLAELGLRVPGVRHLLRPGGRHHSTPTCVQFADIIAVSATGFVHPLFR
jgi:hypothetical protein